MFIIAMFVIVTCMVIIGVHVVDLMAYLNTKQWTKSHYKQYISDIQDLMDEFNANYNDEEDPEQDIINYENERAHELVDYSYTNYIRGGLGEYVKSIWATEMDRQEELVEDMNNNI